MSIGIKAVNKIANSKLFNKLNSPSIAGAASGIALASTMSKDIVATYYYVTQSAKNKKIPPEKRSFVAALDLGNGIMNVIGALAIGLPMKGWMEKLFDSKIEKKYFSTEVAEKTMQKIAEAGKKIDKEKFMEAFMKRKDLAKTGLCVMGTLVGSQIIAKRILTPLIATPMASAFEKLFKKDGGKETKEEKIAMIDSTMPNNINDFQKAHKA
ncbi:hypothetical protein IKA92_03990 [bacterium]|nr:hypothetical protein [bacterium]